MDQQKNGQPIVVITGASGGLGIHLTAWLTKQGWSVRAVDLVSPSEMGRTSLLPETGDIQWFIGPQSDDALDGICQGAHAFIHAAGKVSFTGPERDFRNANVVETKRYFRASQRAGIGHFLYVSCIFVYQTEVMIRTEFSPTSAQNAFERSKLAAEDFLREQTEGDPGLCVSILRPGMLYGPGCTTMGAATLTLPAILRGFSRYLPGLSGGPRTNWCHVHDAARAIETILHHASPGVRHFNATDETPLTFGEVLTSIAEAYEIDLGPSLPLPNTALWAILSPVVDNDWAFEQARRLLTLGWKRIQRVHEITSPLAPKLNRDALFYIRDESVVVATALHELGWEPTFTDFRKSIRTTLRWYQDAGWAPRFDTEAEVERRNATSEHHFHHEAHFEGGLHTDDLVRDFRGQLNVSWPSPPWPPGRREAHLDGSVTIEGLVTEAPLQGTVDLTWLPAPSVEYQFGFNDRDGHPLRFQGKKRFNLRTPANSWLAVEGEVFNRFGENLGLVRLQVRSR